MPDLIEPTKATRDHVASRDAGAATGSGGQSRQPPVRDGDGAIATLGRASTEARALCEGDRQP